MTLHCCFTSYSTVINGEDRLWQWSLYSKMSPKSKNPVTNVIQTALNQAANCKTLHQLAQWSHVPVFEGNCGRICTFLLLLPLTHLQTNLLFTRPPSLAKSQLFGNTNFPETHNCQQLLWLLLQNVRERKLRMTTITEYRLCLHCLHVSSTTGLSVALGCCSRGLYSGVT